MRRRTKTGKSSRKAPGRKASRAKRINSTKTARGEQDAASILRKRLKHRTALLAEAREQQTAAVEVLQVINSSGGDLKPVFDCILEKAHILCDAPSGSLQLYENGRVIPVAIRGMTPSFEAFLRAGYPITDGIRAGLMADQPAQLDLADAVRAQPKEPSFRAALELGGFRTLLTVPLIKDGCTFGRIVAGRKEAEPFANRQIALLQGFAAQAAIAIENARLLTEVQQRTEDLSEALRQQTAVGEVLKTISRSTFELQPVLDTLVRSAAQLCNADMAFIMRRVGDEYRAGAAVGYTDAYIDFLNNNPLPVDRGTVTGRAVLARRPVQILDVVADPEYTLRETTSLAGQRTTLGVPLLRQSEPIGVIVLARQRVEAFTQKQVDLVATFADQAVIAIENVRLFNETQEALERQTATADILKVIASSPADLQPVFDAIADRAKRLVGGHTAAVLRFVGDAAKLMALTPTSPEADAVFKASFPRALKDYPLMALVGAGDTTIVADTETDARYVPAAREAARLRGFRSLLLTPLMGEEGPIGLISATRKYPGTFAPHHVELLKTFADQAVIAIQNVELFEQVQARTRELSESLQFQIASADVLKVISQSPNALQPVLDAIVETSRELCGSEASTFFLLKDVTFHLAAHAGSSAQFLLDHLRANPLRLDQRGSAMARAVRERRTVHIPNTAEDPESAYGSFAAGEPRALLSVPLVRDDQTIGGITLRQPISRPFTSRQIEAVESFADQALIAISNVNLFEQVQARTRDLQEALVHQTSSANILRVIAASPTDVDPVLQAIVENASELCEANDAAVLLKDGNELRFCAHHGPIAINTERWPITRGWSAGRAFLERKPVHVVDILSDEGSEFPDSRELSKHTATTGIRSVLSMPLLRETEAVGVILLRRLEVRPFSDKQIALLQTFADQAVIAISNVSLFEQVQARTRELSRSLDELRTAQDRLVQTEKLASLGQLTAGIAHEIKNPLNFVNNFAALSSELISEMNDALADAGLAEKKRDELDELTQLLKSNLEKVVQHGNRADSIVKNMLLHSREGSGEHRPVDINGVTDESLNLAYHGARAEKPAFQITLQRNFDPAAGTADVYPQELTRVLLNIISNGFYATAKRGQGAANGFEPILSASTKSLGDKVEIRIRDNGIGMAPDVKARIFTPFFTTKPPGEGTGLGLSMSHDIIVKQHGGTIEVETEPGSFTEFIITLPRKMVAQERAAGSSN